MTDVEPFEIRVGRELVADLRERLELTRLPSQPAGMSWELGSDVAYVAELCDHWRRGYDFSRLERLNQLGSGSRRGLHFLRVPAAPPVAGVPVVLLHGWPSGPLEYAEAARLIGASNREAIVPSLPGYAWSEDPAEALNVAAMATRLRELIEEGLGIRSYAVAGGDWGAILAARMAFDAPDRVVALHVSTPHTLPVPGDLADPPLSEAEAAWAERGRRWRRRSGHHMTIQGLAPDAISPALSDSPAGLAAYLLDKYRTWSDCHGEIERRFSKDDLCDFLTMFWSTGSIASSMRLYYGEGHDRWRLEPGERIDVPAGIAVYPGEMKQDGEDLNPPREWSERVLADLRRWEEMPRGGHFAAFEEPVLYAADLLAFLNDL